MKNGVTKKPFVSAAIKIIPKNEDCALILHRRRSLVSYKKYRKLPIENKVILEQIFFCSI